MPEYTEQEQSTLLEIAHESIQSGLENNKPLTVNNKDYGSHLQQVRASFVTLEKNHQLRGCIGSLMARVSLVEDIANNAFNAAFNDPRFPKLTPDEKEQLSIHISVLTVPEKMDFKSESNLLEQIRPGVDGLILADHGHQGTFLPSVWEQLPGKEQFWAHLKNKAGLPINHWSETLEVYRYTTEMIK